jgi:hypothetical protein
LTLVVGLALLLTLLLQIGAGHGLAVAQGTGCQTFRETGKTVCGALLRYWSENGGLMQQGFPITDQVQGAPEVNGKVYTVQYFERAVLELHPDMNPPNDVLSIPLGSLEYSLRYPGGAPSQEPNTSAGSIIFRESGKRLGGGFLTYWQQHGGAAEQGNPISDEFQERSALDGKTYRVQYFERAAFEYHPENHSPYDVLLSQLGTFEYKRRADSNPASVNSAVAGAMLPRFYGKTRGGEQDLLVGSAPSICHLRANCLSTLQ